MDQFFKIHTKKGQVTVNYFAHDNLMIILTQNNNIFLKNPKIVSTLLES